MKRFSLIISFILLLSSCQDKMTDPTLVNEYPPIFPDYLDVTIPVDIAPLNFDYIGGEFSAIDVSITGGKDGNLHISNKTTAEFPIKKWHQLIKENKGDSLSVLVTIKNNKGWIQYKPFSIYISSYPIDYGLAYRKIAPGYEVYSKMGIYERNLSNFNERAVLENTLSPGMCVNCHTFNKANPKELSLHVRGSNGGTILKQQNKLEMLNTKTDSTISSCVYPYWHPDGKYIAYSVNETRQSFHVNKEERIEVLDLSSDVVIYHPESNELILSELLKKKDAFETFPAFSADGKKLYFCSAESRSIPLQYKDIKYSLCSIDFNPETGEVGNAVDTLINARSLDKSVSFPRPSYDGKYIMFTLSDYGNFSIWHKEANLWLLDLNDNSIQPLSKANSDNTESFHNWGTDSHWFVFSSRRGDGLYTRLYLACIDNNGEVTKPFLLPQKNPKKYYDYSVYSYNVPDFVQMPIELDITRAEEMISSKERKQVRVRK